MKIEVSVGEIVDKLSILHIKRENISDEEKLKNVITEYNYLLNVVEKELSISTDSGLYLELLNINKELWSIEDDIRDLERNKDFGDSFIELARSVYFTNDRRAKVKKDINLLYGSELIEEKSYTSYD